MLTIRKKRFAKHYLASGNATDAAKKAGYSEKTAHSQGPRLLEDVDVVKLLEEGVKEIDEKLGITKERIRKEMASMAFADVEETEGLKYTDKNKALEMLARTEGMFTDNVDHTVDGEIITKVEVELVKGT